MPQVGIINPSEFEPINSIEVVIWVAVGGRGTLYGAAAGAVLVNYAKTYFTGALPEVWLYALGAIFVAGHAVPAARARSGWFPRRAEGAMRHAVWPALHRRCAAAATRADVARACATRRRGGRRRCCSGKILYLEKLTVSFDGFKALDGLTLYVDPGELRCIIGPNGAGKTTMMDVITGKTRPDEGSAWFGQNINLLALSEPEIAQAGIGRKFQKPTVFEFLSVFENLELALAGDKSFWRMLRRAPDRRPSASGSTKCSAIDRPDSSSVTRSPARCRTGRSSGSRSACC